jgi:anti-sigma B factor antagonist
VSQLTIHERQTGNVTVLTLTGQMLVDDGDLAFGRQVGGLLDRGQCRIVVDLGGVTFIDSSSVGMLAAKLKQARQQGGDVRLLHLTSRTQRLLGMMKLLNTFETFDEEAAAIGSFEPGPAAP